MDNKADETAVGFSVNEFVLSAIGQWPYQSKWKRSILRTFGNGIMIIANLSSKIIISHSTKMLILQFAALYDVRNDFDAVIERIPMCMTGVFYFINFCTLVTKTTNMGALLDKVKENFKVIKKSSVEEEQILIKAAEEGRSVVFFYSFLLGISTLFYCLVALVPIGLDLIIPLNETRKRNFVYDANYLIIDKHEHYFLVFIHSTVAGVYCFANVIAFDTMLYSFIKHIYGLFEVLKHRLKNILKINEINQTYTEKDLIKMERKTISCLQLYAEIIEFVNEVESCFATCLTFTMGVSAMILCFQGVMIVERIDEPDFVMRFATNFLGQAIHLFYNCYSGQMLVDRSGRFLNYIYESNWYLMPKNQKKLLCMMLLRSIKVCKVTIGNFFILNNETFANLMKTVFSYLSVLMSARDQ
ncbi:odorant receptor 85b-like isoform X2 [Belonocnema kinseyi]|uniref:odorant receptor 85b-like isoform X2 n=1 Tax=Belonocnema kinseyi TaxID=2817044 RepID=UPI00143DD7E3|nr:odorant receptor 85b-like isoform X2 [Belonocnema kinseyi]